MTYQDINVIISDLTQKLKCDYANSFFKDGKKRSNFLIFYFSDSSDIYADGINYQEKCNLTIEYYSPAKDFKSEKTIKDFLKSKDLSYSYQNAYINSEKIHLTTFNMEVLINEQNQIQS